MDFIDEYSGIDLYIWLTSYLGKIFEVWEQILARSLHLCDLFSSILKSLIPSVLSNNGERITRDSCILKSLMDPPSLFWIVDEIRCKYNGNAFLPRYDPRRDKLTIAINASLSKQQQQRDGDNRQKFASHRLCHAISRGKDKSCKVWSYLNSFKLFWGQRFFHLVPVKKWLKK